MIDARILLLGGGNMGSALLGGWLDKGLAAEKVTVVDPAVGPALQPLIDKGVTHRTAVPEGDFDIVLLAVKPQMMTAAVPPLKAAMRPETLVVSIAAGTTIAAIEALLGPHPVVRAMPNTPALIGWGVTGAYGNARCGETDRAAATALLEASGVKPDQVLTSEDVGFKLAPRLNAAGRLGCASLAVELLTTTSASKAAELARVLEGQNGERQARERKYTAHAKDLVEAQFANDPAIVVASDEWHPGVVGIVASRLVDHFGKPALVIAVPPNEQIATGSGRSVPDFALHAALLACDSLLEGHGGHAAAAGFKVRLERIEALRDRFNAYVANHFPGGAPAPRLTLDAEVPLSAITHGLLRDLDKLEPYGAGNARPKFLAAGLKAEAPRLIGSGEVQRHMDFRVRQGETTLRCVAWGMADRMEELMSAGGECCLAFTPKVNEWNGYKKIELQVIDLKPGATAELG